MKCVFNSEILLYYCIWGSLIAYGHYKLFEAQTAKSESISFAEGSVPIVVRETRNTNMTIISKRSNQAAFLNVEAVAKKLVYTKEIFSKYPYLQLSKTLSAGWIFLNRKQDISDIEWNCWKYYIQTSWFYLTFQFFVSEILRKFNASTLKYWYLLSSIFFISRYMGFVILSMILIQPIIFLTVLLCGGKRIGIWLTSLILISWYDLSMDNYFFYTFLEDRSSRESAYILYSAMGWTNLRCINYCLDHIERQDKDIRSEAKKNYQIFINLFSYVLYLPVLFYAPLISYDDFEKSFQRNAESLSTRLKQFAVNIVLFIIYSFLLEFASHFIYFRTISSYIKLIKRIPTVELCAGGLWMSHTFYVKYVILYGTVSALARLDNMDAPPTPRCIARIHVYSNMWRYFDVALYNFLVKYIYKPCYTTLCQYKKISNNVCKLIASFSPFAFIFLWHGAASNIFIWSIMNYIAILIEHAAKALSRTTWYKHFKSKFLNTEAMEARFIASACVPLLVYSGLSNFYFLGGIAVGHVYVGLLGWPTLYTDAWLIFIAGYCCCQVSISLLDVPSRTDRRLTVKVD